MHDAPTIRNVRIQDLDRCFAIERAGYGGEEAATIEKIKTRIETYPEGFLVLEHNEEVLGFINCGACYTVELSDEDFKELIGHTPEGPNIVIMSVVVHPSHQHLGYAQQLMHAFIKQMQAMNKQDIYLICQEELIGFYEQFGYKRLGVSDSTHGGLQWHEMVIKLPHTNVSS